MRIVMVAAVSRRESVPQGIALWRLAEALAESGTDVTVIATSSLGLGDAVLPERLLVRPIAAPDPAAPLHRRVPGMARQVRDVIRAIEEETRFGDAHVVHAHGWLPAGIAAAKANRHGRALVLTLHEPDARFARSGPLGRYVLGHLLRKASLVTATSSYVADAVAPPGTPARTALAVTPMPMLGAVVHAPAPEGIPHGVVFVGRLVRGKGVPVLLEALALLRRQGIPLDLTVVGDGPDRVALKARARALGLPVVFAGFVAPEQVAEHLAGRRVLVLPSVEPGQGRAVAEALAHGLPVVASRIGAIPDLLAEEGAGELVPPGDANALAAAIRKVVTNDAYLVGAANAGRALLARLAPASVAGGFNRLYGDARRRRSGALAGTG